VSSKECLGATSIFINYCKQNKGESHDPDEDDGTLFFVGNFIHRDKDTLDTQHQKSEGKADKKSIAGFDKKTQKKQRNHTAACGDGSGQKHIEMGGYTFHHHTDSHVRPNIKNDILNNPQ
jgi:hypothetical protein